MFSEKICPVHLPCTFFLSLSPFLFLSFYILASFFLSLTQMYVQTKSRGPLPPPFSPPPLGESDAHARLRKTLPDNFDSSGSSKLSAYRVSISEHGIAAGRSHRSASLFFSIHSSCRDYRVTKRFGKSTIVKAD